VFNISDAGEGIIVQDTGRVVDVETGEVLEVNAPHQALDDEFLEQTVCAALSDRRSG
jgi:hypothetical protein